MKKIIALLVFLLLLAMPGFAAYFIILKDGTRYRAKEKWKVVSGKAIITLDTGTVIQVDPALIDVGRTEEVNRLGLGDVNVIAVGKQEPQSTPKRQTESLATVGKLRELPPLRGQKTPPESAAPASGEASAPAQGDGKGILQNDVLSKFVAAFENVGLFGATVTSPAPHTVEAIVTTDNEDQVFKAISATSWVMLRIPSITGARIDVVKLRMGTLTGSAAGRFDLTREDAERIDKKQFTLQEYFVQKVMF